MFNPMPPQFKEDGVRFVGLITKLMERLLDYRTVVLGDDNIDNRMSCTVNVLVSKSLFFLGHPLMGICCNEGIRPQKKSVPISKLKENPNLILPIIVLKTYE